MAGVTTGGATDPAFARVGEAFAEVLAGQPALGAGLCVVVEGRTVLDVWGGHADIARTRPWAPDSVVNVYSATKALVAVAAHRLAERGALDLDAPVARGWPEFAAAGKAAITTRWLLDHSAGLPAVRAPLPPGTLYVLGTRATTTAGL